MSYKMVPGGRADKATQAVKKTVTRGAAGAGVGAVGASGAFLEPSMGAAGMAAAAASLPPVGTAALAGAALAIGVPMAYKAGKALLGRKKHLDEGFNGARN